ncbi:MAG TPA: class II aldolase/adducin family protein [Candidatus Krumholzibacteria bacterium]|nr:class II aldolase/adducin family protein [Candidatus Krumholzibacteria bacterium]
MFQVPDQIRHEILHVCRRLYDRGLVAGTDGNVSVRLGPDRILATPTGMSKGFLEADDLVVCDLEGKQISGKRKLTTEIKIHLAAYTQRDDVCAIVHAHPPHATAFAVARKPLEERLMPEAYIAVGKVALTQYGTPSTDELEASIRPAVKEHDAILLANHGAMTLGRDVTAAYHRMEALEQLARISMLTHVLGGAHPLTAEEIARLEAIRGVYGGTPSDTPCYHCGWTPRAATKPEHTPAGSTAATRPTSYVEPEVHWEGNPPVWERHAATDVEAQVRDLARRTLREVRDAG